MTQPRQGRHIRKISLLTELEIPLVGVSTNMPRRRRWQPWAGLNDFHPVGMEPIYGAPFYVPGIAP